jgi:hypothetical protein
LRDPHDSQNPNPPQIEAPTLRPYQAENASAVRREIAAGKRRVLDVAAKFDEVPDPFEARIWTFGDRSFQLDETGPVATLLPVELEHGVEIDTVAWLHDRPRPWFFQLHVATRLGDRALRQAQWYQRPVRLVATPADWLRDSQTVCVLDWWSCDLRGLFGDVPKVICASDAQMRFLLRRLAEQVAPRFEIEVVR